MGLLRAAPEALARLLTELIVLGALFRIERLVKFRVGPVVDTGHLSDQVALLSGQVVDLGHVTGLHRAPHRLRVLPELRPDWLGLLTGLAENGSSLRLLRGSQVQFTSHPVELPLHHLAMRSLRLALGPFRRRVRLVSGRGCPAGLSKCHAGGECAGSEDINKLPFHNEWCYLSLPM